MKLDYFYRGVYNGKEFDILPSVYRKKYYGKEDLFYHNLKSRCCSELKGRSHLDTLVTLQHYECPTRLLDLTSNPLVALYFACKNYNCKNCDIAEYGYVYVLGNPNSNLLFSDSDKVIILSCLARFSLKEQEKIYNECIKIILKEGINAVFSESNCPECIDRLYHEINSELNFEKRILARDLLKNYFVQPDITNRRIDKQSGSFMICGLGKDPKEILDKISKNVIYKIKVVNQQKILEELDILNINEASLFPELDKVARYYLSKI